MMTLSQNLTAATVHRRTRHNRQFCAQQQPRLCHRLTICFFISDLTIRYYCETSRLDDSEDKPVVSVIDLLTVSYDNLYFDVFIFFRSLVFYDTEKYSAIVK